MLRPAIRLLAAIVTCAVANGSGQNSAPGPTADETAQFIANHIHPYRAECTSANGRGFAGQVLEIQSVSADNGILNITYDGGAGGAQGSGTVSHQIELTKGQHLANPLRSIAVSSIRMEHLPFKEECDLTAEGDGQRYRDVETPEYWLRFSDGQHDLSDFGLPVQDEEEGGRVRNALLHLIELAGGQTKEVF